MMRVEHRGENCSEPIAPFSDSLDHPAFGFLQRPLPQRATMHTLEKF